MYIYIYIYVIDIIVIHDRNVEVCVMLVKQCHKPSPKESPFL